MIVIIPVNNIFLSNYFIKAILITLTMKTLKIIEVYTTKTI